MRLKKLQLKKRRWQLNKLHRFMEGNAIKIKSLVDRTKTVAWNFANLAP